MPSGEEGVFEGGHLVNELHVIDAPFDLGAKPLVAGPAVELGEGAGVGGSIAVANAIEAGEVGRGPGRDDDIADGDDVAQTLLAHSQSSHRACFCGQ